MDSIPLAASASAAAAPKTPKAEGGSQEAKPRVSSSAHASSSRALAVFVPDLKGHDDPVYAEKVRAAFRKLTDWMVEPKTRIWNDLGEFAAKYSKSQRDPTEVATIFSIANKIIKMCPDSD
jgi:hypothetical protein